MIRTVGPDRGIERRRGRSRLSSRSSGVPRGDTPQEGGPDDSTSNGVTRAKEFQACLAEAGFAGITWPRRYGGRGLPARFQRIFDSEARAFQLPPRALEIGLGMCGPTILAHGNEEQKLAFIPPLLRGDHVWCELFSEPGAGSDLASVQTRAVRDGDTWVLTDRRSGRLVLSTATTPPVWRAPTPVGPSARASRCSLSTCVHPA